MQKQGYVEGYTTFTSMDGLAEGVLGLLEKRPHSIWEVHRKISKSSVRQRMPGYSFFTLVNVIENLAVNGFVEAPTRELTREDIIQSI